MQQVKTKHRINKQNIPTIIAASFLVLTHVAVILAIILSFRYYAIYPSLFGSVVAIVICLLIIADIVFFVGFNHKDLALKIISCVLSVMLLAGGTVGTVLLAKANGIVDNVLDSNSTKTEVFSGYFVCYKKNNSFISLNDLANKRVGMLSETSDGLSYVATSVLNETKIDYAVVNYKTNAEMVQALVDGDIDAMAITSAYRDIYSIERDENSPFAKYLDDFIDFYSFEKELKVQTNRKTKNLSTDPFNVLLIGYSRTDIGSTVGLADSIIIATINPQTYTVSMMSIARDSFVPIPCYGGEYDKINSGRSTSRQCFIETVENFIGMDIDYYMELDYLGLVQIVNTIGGITINNPVEFELDGIYVPAGENVFADGQMALQFCRERHHMPNGDFDRQQHQKEVIIQIAKKFINSGDVSLALKAMDAASRWMSTDLTLNQLTSVFNLLLNTKNYTSINTFNLVDFQTLRMTGSGGLKYYSYSMRLPLWVYLIYQGSYDESIEHINEIMGNYKIINQDKNFEFSSINLYDRPLFYSLEYDEKYMFTPDPMPPYWADLTGMTLSDAMAWASGNGAKISKVEYITAGDPNYKAELEGLICEQSVRYGSLISEYPSTTVIVMGTGEFDESKFVPNFVGRKYKEAVDWARKYEVNYSIDFNTEVSGEIGRVVEQKPEYFTPIGNVEKLVIVVKAGTYTIKFDLGEHGGKSGLVPPEDIEVTTGDEAKTFKEFGTVTEADGKRYRFVGWFTKDGNEVNNSLDVTENTTLYAHWEFDCEHEWKEDASANGNVPATCTGAGTQYYKCNICGETKYETLEPLGHDWSEWVTTIEPKETTDGEKTRSCKRDGCSASETEIIPATGGGSDPDPVPEVVTE